MRVVFSFDDGRIDAYNAYQILTKHGLKGSFHVTTGFIDGTFSTDAFGVNRLPLTKENLVEMHANGMDISSHGDKHCMDEKDFKLSVGKLREFGINSKKFGFSVPNSDFKEDELSSFIDANKNDLSYIRIGRHKDCYTFFRKVCYILYHLSHLQFFYNKFNKPNLIENLDIYRVNSLVVLSDCKATSLINFVKKYSNENVTLVLMFHSIVEEPKNKWEYSIDDFEEICKYISHNCESITLKELSEYAPK